MLLSRTKKAQQIVKMTNVSSRSYKYETPDAYNKRWHWEFKYAYYTYPPETDQTKVKKPEDSREYDSLFATYTRDWKNRALPGVRQYLARAHRCATPFELIALPLAIFIPLQFIPLDLGFAIYTAIPMFALGTRISEKIKDPKPEETYLREMIHTNEVLKKHFAVETMQIMDYEIEYTKGFPDAEEFPEFENKIFRFLIRVLQQRHPHDQRTLRLR